MISITRIDYPVILSVAILLILVIVSSSTPNDILSQENLSSNFRPEWIPFKSNQDISIKPIGVNNSSFFIIEGSTKDQNEGFSAYNQYLGEFIAVGSGLMNKSNSKNSELESQFTISFKILGKNDNYTISLVNGRLAEQGWVEKIYYDKIIDNSSLLINLPELVATMNDSYLKNDSYLGVEKTILGIEKNTYVEYIIFSLNFIDKQIP
jgi:hypothetical protein